MRIVKNAPDLRIPCLVFIGVGGIVAHLASEFTGMGEDAAGIVFSARHWYLALGACLGIVILARQLRALRHAASGSRDLKRLLNVGSAALPFHGRGPLFFGMIAALQFAVGSLTEIGEGCPFCSHDMVSGVAGALISVIVLALLARRLAGRLPGLVVAFVERIPLESIAGRNTATQLQRTQPALSPANYGLWYPLLFNRPPPVLQLQPIF